MAPILEMQDGRVIDFVGLNQAFTLKTPRDYRGRVGAAIPTGGIILPAAKNGQSPITHSISNLPVGLSFDATTRAITGSPTGTYTTREVAYSATDSATPAVTVDVTFEFPVVGSTALITRDDWDSRGYGLETRTTYLLALIQSEGDVGFGGDENLWLKPPYSGTATGLLIDDDGNTLTDFSDMTYTEGGESVFVSRILIQQGTDRVRFYETSALHHGTYFRDVLGSPSLYMTIGSDEQEILYLNGFGADVSWRRTTPDLGAFLRGIDDGTRVLLGVAAP